MATPLVPLALVGTAIHSEVTPHLPLLLPVFFRFARNAHERVNIMMNKVNSAGPMVLAAKMKLELAEPISSKRQALRVPILQV